MDENDESFLLPGETQEQMYARIRKDFVFWFAYWNWIEKSPVESRDRTIYWLEKLKEQFAETPVALVIKAAEETTPNDRAHLLVNAHTLAEYLTKLDVDIVNVRGKLLQIVDRFMDEFLEGAWKAKEGKG